MFIAGFTSDKDKSLLRDNLPLYKLAAKLHNTYGFSIGCAVGASSPATAASSIWLPWFSLHASSLKCIGRLFAKRININDTNDYKDGFCFEAAIGVKRRRKFVQLAVSGDAAYLWTQIQKRTADLFGESPSQEKDKTINDIYNQSVLGKLIEKEYIYCKNEFGRIELSASDFDEDLFVALVHKSNNPDYALTLQEKEALHRASIPVDNLVKSRNKKAKLMDELRTNSRYLYFYSRDVGYTVMKSKLRYVYDFNKRPSKQIILESIEIPPVVVRNLEDLRGGPLEPAFIKALMLRSVYQRDAQHGNGMLLTKEDGAQSKVYPDFGAMVCEIGEMSQNWNYEIPFNQYIQSMAYILA